MVECAGCHANVSTSTKTSDVNLPTIARCSECHSDSGGARADCVLCHSYHPHEGDFAGPKPAGFPALLKKRGAGR